MINITRNIAVLLFAIMPGIFLAMQPFPLTMIPSLRLITALKVIAEIERCEDEDTIAQIKTMEENMRCRLPVEVQEYLANMRQLMDRYTKPTLHSIHNNPTSALITAAAMGFAEVVSDLVAMGADVNSTGIVGDTPLNLLLKNGKFQAAARLLLEQGAKVDLADRNGYAPLHVAVEKSGNSAIINLLLDYKANINAASNGEWTTPLMRAVKQRNVENVRLLLERGANATLRDINGRAALYWAYNAARTLIREEVKDSVVIIDLLKKHLPQPQPESE